MDRSLKEKDCFDDRNCPEMLLVTMVGAVFTVSKGE